MIIVGHVCVALLGLAGFWVINELDPDERQ